MALWFDQYEKSKCLLPGSYVGINGPVGKAEDQRSESRGFDSGHGSWPRALSKLLGSHALPLCITGRVYIHIEFYTCYAD